MYRVELTAREIEEDVKNAVNSHEFKELQGACDLIDRMS